MLKWITSRRCRRRAGGGRREEGEDESLRLVDCRVVLDEYRLN